MEVRPILNQALKSFEKPFAVHNSIGVCRLAMLNNFDLFARLSPGGFVIPVLKANAYGHGIEAVAGILAARAFPYLAVDGYFEALRVRAVSRQPVLVMGAIARENFARMRFGNFAFVVGDAATVEALGRTGKRVKVHIELDTGMTRYGVPMADLAALLGALRRYPRIEVEGVMSHLADADNPDDDTYDERQTALFDLGVEQVRAAGFDPKYLHLAQSAGSVKVHSRFANTLRVGIAMYGISPLEAGDPAGERLRGLRPALELRSTITKVLEIGKGETVGYGCTFTARRPSRIGVLPLGYYEGVPRSLSNVGQVKSGDEYLPMVGRVCMNHTMIDLTDSAAAVGDGVALISSERNDPTSLESICSQHNLFIYAVLVGLNQNIRRRVI